MSPAETVSKWLPTSVVALVVSDDEGLIIFERGTDGEK